MIEDQPFFNYGASLNNSYKMFIGFRNSKPKDNALIINVG